MQTEQKTVSSFGAFWRRLSPREPQESAPPSLRWRPHSNGNGNFPALVVTQGDLTACAADAIMCPLSTQLSHSGGVAAAILRKSGRAVKNDCKSWIRQLGRLPMGNAIAIPAGKLPCRHVIFTVGPDIKDTGFQPSLQQVLELRAAVWSALCEADRLQLTSIALPAIACGNAGYRDDMVVMEIVGECLRFVCEKVESTTLKTVVFMDADAKTCRSFARVLRVTAESHGNGEIPEMVMGDVFVDTRTITITGMKSDAELSSDDGCYRKTGVLPARVGANDFELLVGVGQACGRRCVILLGNERVGNCISDAMSRALDDQGVLQTACQRFAQDTGGLLSADGVYQAINEASRTLLLKSATIFIARLDRQLPGDFCGAFEEVNMQSWSHAACDHVLWISWTSLKIAASAAMDSAGEHTVRTSRGDFPLSNCMCSLVEKHAEDVERGLESLLLKTALQHELERVDSLKTLKDEKLLDEVLGCSWRLQLPSPFLPPLPSLEYLSPSDPEYQSFIAQLPRHTASRVVSVRRVNNSVHREAYHKVKNEISASRINECVVFHGTIERWRATAIALNGFDLSIRLHGRSYGDGVYTSTDVNFSTNYVTSFGSILKLRGLVSTTCRDANNNTIVHGSVHVFPNPKALLPVLIADFAAEDERDALEKQRRRIPHEYTREEKRWRRIQDAKELEMFKSEVGQRLRMAVDIYAKSLRALQVDTASQGRSPARRFFLERRKFALCFPIYEVKPALVNVLLEKPIVIVIGDAGSGKSTQLPQFLLDQVLRPHETRRIAILEPRRVHAISLSKLVSEERGLAPGQEVGYTVSRGDSNVTPGVTRLEFMTHEVFIQMARDPVHLQKIYSTVIFDAAHERSLDADLSLALLRRVLQQRVPAFAPCKVVVAGAMSEEVSMKWQRLLDPSLLQSAIFQIPTRALPVRIKHYVDTGTHEAALGTAKVDQVVRSAVASLVKLFRTAEQGNVLVFVPGEEGVRKALEATRRTIKTSATVVQLDTCGSGSSGFGFRTSIRSTSSGNDGDTQQPTRMGTDVGAATTNVIGFHDHITPVELDHVLNPSPFIDRLVVFATQAAETGVAVPNVRYVIDTGLESRVLWNPTFGGDEIVIERISKTSMVQRARRAGHTARGICVRLYPENHVEQPNVFPAVQNSAMVYTTVLLNKELSNRADRPLEMWDPLDPSSVTLAEQRLFALGAVDSQNVCVTREGKALLRLGIDLRLAKFLITCARFGCLATGIKLVSVLMVDGAPKMLLPSRNLHPRTECMHSLIDRRGDHLTLFNIMEAYESACSEGRGVSWCQEAEVSSDVFIQADIAREKLLKVLDELEFALVDAPSVRASSEHKKTCLRQALCAAFYDQLACPQVAKQPVMGFVRVADNETKHELQRRAGASTSGFFAKLRARAASPHKANEAAMDDLLTLGDSSTMWLPSVSSDLVPSHECVVFGSCVVTEDKPVISLVTRVTAEDIKVGAQEVCRPAESRSPLDTSSRETFVMDLPGDAPRGYLANPAKLLQALPSEFEDSVTATIEHGKLYVTSAAHRQAQVEHYLRKYIQTLIPESVTIQLSPTADVSAHGDQVESLRASIEQFLVREQCGVGQQHVCSRLLCVDPSRNTVTVTLQGPSKSLMSIVVGRVQSAIAEIFGAEILPTAFDPCNHRIPRLMQLLASTPPTSRGTRDDIVLQIAHALLWTCGASLHGVSFATGLCEANPSTTSTF